MSRVDGISTEAAITRMNEQAPPCVTALGGQIESFDHESRRVVMRFRMPLEFCHSGNVVQGGFVTGMLDAAMAHAVFMTLGERLGLPSLEISVSFLRPTLAGEHHAHGRIVRLGRTIAFLEGELFDGNGVMTARATSTAMLVRPADTGG